jgi:ParB family chromosome partitioning protein
MAATKKKTTAADPAKKTTRTRKVKPAAGSVGISAEECGEGSPPAPVSALGGRVGARGGCVLATYREPLGGHWVVLASLPIDAVEPTPYQRELSKAHADRLATVIPKVGRFLDPIIAVDAEDKFITPNGMHRLSALRALGAKAITALLVPEPEVAFRILALNTEKAHNLKDKALEVIRMARALATDQPKRPERDFAFEFEQAALITIGVCYEKNARFSGGAYMSVVSKCEDFSDDPLAKSLPVREERADKLIELDTAVTAAVGKLKEAGWTSGYLKPIVVARVNPLRFVKSKPGDPKPDFDKTIDKMIDGAKKFDASKVKATDVAIAASASGGEGEE